MKHSFFLSTFFLAIFFMSSEYSSAAIYHIAASAVNKKNMAINCKEESRSTSLPAQQTPVSNQEEPIKKSHLSKTEELAHIHHFHKERVKRLKRHHKKYWILTKLLLILCHLLLLACAYIHLTH